MSPYRLFTATLFMYISLAAILGLHQVVHEARIVAQHERIADRFAASEVIALYLGDCLDLLTTIPDESGELVVTSPPYNIGKEYEKRLDLDPYLQQQEKVIAQCVCTLSPHGSIC